MESYLPINWWKGNLRPYESVISFLTRFNELNSTTVNQCEEFFGCQVGYDRQLTGADIGRIAFLLNEDLSLVQSVFSPSVTLDHCGHYKLPWVRSNSDSVRYCEECAVAGYHSYLHEVRWLSKCPFHMSDLKTCYSKKNAGSIAIRRMAALKNLMQLNCNAWPCAAEESFAIHMRGHLHYLDTWTKNASSAALQLSQGQIWRSDGGAFIDETSIKHAMGRLRTLAVMPKAIEPLFNEIGRTWLVEIRRFPLQAKADLASLRPDISFDILFDFYKGMIAYSAIPPPFVAKRQAAQDAIKERHGRCHCKWGLVQEGWHHCWRRVHPDEWPHWACICPYDVAVNELEFGWGRADVALSTRKAAKERLRLITLSRLMRDAGLIGYTRDASVSPEGYLYMYPQVWPCCEWIHNSPLTDLLNAAAEFEIDSAVSRLNTWLGHIDDGFEPTVRDDPTSCVRLCETEEGLSLIKWWQTEHDECNL